MDFTSAFPTVNGGNGGSWEHPQAGLSTVSTVDPEAPAGLDAFDTATPAGIS
jgi:hypothetical protein